MYRIFNAVVDSNISLPELPQNTQERTSEPTIVFRVSDSPLQIADHPHWFHHWYSDEEKTKIAISIARKNGDYILRFTGLADFLLDVRHSSIQCHPLSCTPADTVRHLFLDHVVPRLMGHQGNLILHASVIVMPSGAGIAFLGKSGWGKSTIASSFYQCGARLVTDDSLLLEENDGRLIGIPAYAGSRLWQDSADTVFPGHSGLALVSHNSTKKRLILHGQPGSSTEAELQAIFLLNDPEDAVLPEEIKIDPVGGADAIMTMIRRAFLLDVEDMDTVARQFTSASRIASTNPAMYSLSYPRDYELLADVRTAVLSVINARLENKRNSNVI